MGFKILSNEESNVKVYTEEIIISPLDAIEYTDSVSDMNSLEYSCEGLIGKMELANDVVSNGFAMSDTIVATSSNEDNFALEAFNNTISILGMSNEGNAVGFYDPEAASKHNKEKSLATDSKSLIQRIISAIKSMFKKITTMVKKLYVKSLKVMNGMTVGLIGLAKRIYKLEDGASVSADKLDIDKMYNSTGALALLSNFGKNERHFTPNAINTIKRDMLDIAGLADYEFILAKIISQMKALGEDVKDDYVKIPSSVVNGFLNEIKSVVQDTLDGPIHKKFMEYFKDDLDNDYNTDMSQYVVSLISKVSGRSVKVVVVTAPRVIEGTYTKSEILAFTNKITISTKTYTFDDTYKDIFAEGIKDTDSKDLQNSFNVIISMYFGNLDLVNSKEETIIQYVDKRFKEYNDAAFKLINVSEKAVKDFGKDKDKDGLSLLDMVPLKFINVGMSSLTLDAVIQYINVIKSTFSYQLEHAKSIAKNN